MNKGRQPTRWLRAFPRAWRDRYGGELSALVDDLRERGDLRPSDRIDMVRRGLAMRRHRPRRRSVYAALGVVSATVCALVGLAFAGTFGSRMTPGSPAPRWVVELHTHGVAVPATRVLALCHVTTPAREIKCPKEITTITVTVRSPGSSS